MPNLRRKLAITMGSTDRISVRTTTNVDGMIAVIDPKLSWVGLWQRTSKQVREMYAVRVDGRIPEDVEAELETPNQTDQD
ncbi:hypothetical protein EDD17DRAFT_1670786 [Pisolithus thermaeus]|nr:hypothetical protein EDD17DRAFT_1670786 [Pisolithus thermaeus]